MAKIKKQDIVKVISGDDKGKVGTVIQVLPVVDKLIVEGVKSVKRHQKPDKEGNGGGIIEKLMPIHISNVRLVSEGKKGAQKD